MESQREEVNFRVGAIIVATGAVAFEPKGLYGYSDYESVMTQLQFQKALKDKEIEDAKCHIKGTMILAKQDMEVRMKRIARQFIVMNKILTYEESVAIIESVTREDIIRVIDFLIKCENFNLLVYGCQGVAKYKDNILNF